MRMMNQQQLAQSILEIVRQAGVANAAQIQQKDIIYDRVFRDICASNGCGNYGMCYMCPPDIGDIDELMKKAQEYDLGILYQTISPIEDSFDFEGMVLAGQQHNQCAQKIHTALEELHLGNMLHLASGACRLCERCAKRDQLPCRFPDRALSSLEAYGIHVSQTAANAGLKYVNGPNTVTYFGMVLVKEDLNA